MADGRVQIVFADFALHGQSAVINAEAAHCAREQGQYWTYHDLLYAGISQDEARYDRKDLDGFARKLKLDMAAFGQCLDDHRYRDMVVGLTEEGRKLGLEIVPTLLVNQQIIEGYVPFTELQPYIERELDRQKDG